MRISGIAPRAYIGNYKALTIPDAIRARPERQRARDRGGDRGGRRRRHGRHQPLARRARDRAVARHRRARARRCGRGAASSRSSPPATTSRTSVAARSALPGSAADAITVGATTSAHVAVDRRASPRRGRRPISLRLKPDVVAPGTSILSSQPGGWGLSSGTSMATPHVAGAVALLLQRHPDWTPREVKAALTATARPVAAGDGHVGPTRAGAGLVDVAAADAPARAADADGRLVRARPRRDDREPERRRRGRRAAAPGLGGLGRARAGRRRAPSSGVPPTITVPGPLPLDLVAGATRRRGRRCGRAPPRWRRAARSRSGGASRSRSSRSTGARTLQRPGIYAGQHARTPVARRHVPLSGGPRRRPRVGSPRRPRAGVPRPHRRGPSRTSALRSSQRGPGSRVEPRVVRGGDENRLTGYAALPLDQNPYVDGVRQPGARRGRAPPRARDVLRRLRQPDRRRRRELPLPLLGRRRQAPPSATLVEPDGPSRRPDQAPRRRRRLGHRRPLDRGDARRPARARAAGRDARSGSRRRPLAAGRHRLRVALSDFQETRNNENVARILPNTRIVSVTVTIVAR